jgi:hypothetical protein
MRHASIVEFNVKDARSARIIIHELSDYSYDTYGIFPPLRTHPIVQPSHRHFQHNITLAHSLDSMGEFIIPRRSAYHDFFPMLGFLSVIERQGEAECKPTPGFLLLWGQQTVLKYGRFETIEPWCKVLQKDGNMSREDLVRAAMEYYRAKVNGGFGFELPSSDSTVVLHETTNLTVHAGIRLVEFLDWAIYDLQITINEDGGGSGSSLHGQ